MYKILLSIAIVFLPLLVNAQCPSASITITTQAQIDNFNTTYSGCTAPTKSIIINGSAILNLTGLQNITSFGSDLTIEETSLTDLSGLQNVTQIAGGINLRQNSLMSTLNGLQNLVSINGSLTLWMTPITTCRLCKNWST